MRVLHPAVVTALVGLLLIGSQLLSGVPLAIACLAALTAAVAGAHRRLLRMLRRSRFLMLAIVVMFAWFSPGQRLFTEPAWLSPTFEGLLLATIHGGRLLIALALVSLLLERLPADELLQGLSTLARPLSVIGWDAERFAVRLSLVMRLVTESSGRDWRCWLDDEVDAAMPQVVAISARPFGARDVFALLLVTAALACLVVVA
ncbi:MAG: hypothetical protein KDI56_00480 [Xanthomonadales bacterium]|nr:hypothetical protein [Xanthomonadales bacterium]